MKTFTVLTKECEIYNFAAEELAQKSWELTYSKLEGEILFEHCCEGVTNVFFKPKGEMKRFEGTIEECEIQTEPQYL